MKEKFINKDKLMMYYDRFKDGIKPITAEMIMTNFCNYDCSYCRYKHGKGYFKFDDFTKAVKELERCGVKGFILTGGGEPFLNPDIERILNWLDDNNIKYGVNTNLTNLYKCGAEWIKTSIHENYDVENVLENIKKCREINKSTVLGVQCIVKEKKDIKEFYDKYCDLDVDYIVFRPLEMQDKIYTKKQADEIIEELVKLKERDEKVSINYKWYMLGMKFDNCIANWTVATVDYKGDMWYCCHKPQEVVGNIFKDGALKVLEDKKSFKSDMKVCDKPCRMTCNNIILNGEKIKHIEFI